jgi:hypothetical protein
MTLFLWLWRGWMARSWPLLAVAVLLMVIEGGSLGLFAAMMEPMFDDARSGGSALSSSASSRSAPSVRWASAC